MYDLLDKVIESIITIPLVVIIKQYQFWFSLNQHTKNRKIGRSINQTYSPSMLSTNLVTYRQDANCYEKCRTGINDKIFILYAFICSFYFLSTSETGSLNEAVYMIRNIYKLYQWYSIVLKVQYKDFFYYVIIRKHHFIGMTYVFALALMLKRIFSRFI